VSGSPDPRGAGHAPVALALGVKGRNFLATELHGNDGRCQGTYTLKFRIGARTVLSPRAFAIVASVLLAFILLFYIF